MKCSICHIRLTETPRYFLFMPCCQGCQAKLEEREQLRRTESQKVGVKS